VILEHSVHIFRLFANLIIKIKNSVSHEQRAAYLYELDYPISHINDATHDCVKIDYICGRCHEEFSYIYEYSSSGKTQMPGSYSKVYKIKYWSTERRSMAFINQWYKEMYGDGNEYNLLTRNCKYWARSFFTRIVYLDPLVISIQDFLDQKVFMLPKIYNDKIYIIRLTHSLHWNCQNIQGYISDMPSEWREVLDLFFSIDNSSFTVSLLWEFLKLFEKIVVCFGYFIIVIMIKNRLEKIHGADRSTWSLTNGEISEIFGKDWSVSYASEIIKELRNPDTLEAKLNEKLIESKNLVNDFKRKLPNQQSE
jgi:hypothetical protein